VGEHGAVLAMRRVEHGLHSFVVEDHRHRWGGSGRGMAGGRSA
jgi:hypothetical protein